MAAGQAIFKPRGIPHSFALASEKPVRFLETILPAGFEGYFRSVGELLNEGAPPNPESVARLMVSYGLRDAYRQALPRRAP